MPANIPRTAFFHNRRPAWPPYAVREHSMPMPHTLRHLSLVLCCAAIGAAEPCRIVVVDQESQWPVPLVELITTGHVRYVSDNAGVVAFDQPELMGQETWLDIRSPGYGVGKDGFGNRGRRITPEP